MARLGHLNPNPTLEMRKNDEAHTSSMKKVRGLRSLIFLRQERMTSLEGLANGKLTLTKKNTWKKGAHVLRGYRG